MSQSQGIEVRRPSRRTIATGAAWAVPVIAVGAAAPAMAASPNCVPSFTVVPEESFKCCDGAIKNMKLTHPRHGRQPLPRRPTRNVCIITVTPLARPTSPSARRSSRAAASAPTEGDIITVYLLNVSDCTVNLLIELLASTAGPHSVAALKSGNISSGNTAGDCLPDLSP